MRTATASSGPALLERFRGAKPAATAGVADSMPAQYCPRWFDGLRDSRFPGQTSPRHVVAEPLGDGDMLELEGEQLHAIGFGHTDTEGSSALHGPSIGLVVAGDAVYGGVHMYLAESRGAGRVRPVPAAVADAGRVWRARGVTGKGRLRRRCRPEQARTRRAGGRIARALVSRGRRLTLCQDGPGLLPGGGRAPVALGTSRSRYPRPF